MFELGIIFSWSSTN